LHNCKYGDDFLEKKYYDVSISPRYAETDQMGVIYHGNYFTYFEVARTTFFKQLGYSYKKMEERGFMLPVIDVACRYRKSIFYDDDIFIRTSVDSVKGIRIGFSYKIYRKTTDELLAEGKTFHAFVDSNMKPIKYSSLDENFRMLIEEYSN